MSLTEGTVNGRESVLVRTNGATARVTFDRVGSEGRHVFAWRLGWFDDARGWQSVEGTDLSSGAPGVGSDPVQMLGALGSFLGAYAEAIQYGDSEDDGSNAGLFPKQLPADVAQTLADEIDSETYDGND